MSGTMHCAIFRESVAIHRRGGGWDTGGPLHRNTLQRHTVEMCPQKKNACEMNRRSKLSSGGPLESLRLYQKSHQVFFLVEEVIWSYQTKPPGIKLHIQCIYNGMNSCIVNIDNEKCWNVEHCKQPQPSFLVHAGSGLVSQRRRLVLHCTDSWKSDVHRWYMQPLCIAVIQLGKVGRKSWVPLSFLPPPPDIVLSFQRQGWVFMQLLHTAKINSHGKLLKHSHCLQLLLSLSPFWFWFIPVSNI